MHLNQVVYEEDWLRSIIGNDTKAPPLLWLGSRVCVVFSLTGVAPSPSENHSALPLSEDNFARKFGKSAVILGVLPARCWTLTGRLRNSSAQKPKPKFRKCSWEEVLQVRMTDSLYCLLCFLLKSWPLIYLSEPVWAVCHDTSKGALPLNLSAELMGWQIEEVQVLSEVSTLKNSSPPIWTSSSNSSSYVVCQDLKNTLGPRAEAFCWRCKRLREKPWGIIQPPEGETEPNSIKVQVESGR